MGFNLRRVGVVAASLGMVAATLAVTAPAAGAAISQGRIQLCSQGNYGSWLLYSSPGISSIGTDSVPKGTCKTFTVPASGTLDFWTVSIRGIYNTSGTSFGFGQFQSGSYSPGLKVATVGTTTSPAWKIIPNT
jgi:hypothetical protein